MPKLLKVKFQEKYDNATTRAMSYFRRQMLAAQNIENIHSA